MSQKKNSELNRLDNQIRALGRSQDDYKPWLILNQVGTDRYQYDINQAPVKIPLETLMETNRIVILDKR